MKGRSLGEDGPQVPAESKAPESAEHPQPQHENWDMVIRETESKSYKERVEAYEKADSEEAKYELLKDQGYTRPKALILVPFKAQAYDVVNELVMQFRHRWKGTAKKKKFKEEYGSAEEAGNDCFRLGIAFYGNVLKLFASFAESDLIIGKSGSDVQLRLWVFERSAQKKKQRRHRHFCLRWSSCTSTLPISSYTRTWSTSKKFSTEPMSCPPRPKDCVTSTAS